MLPFSAQFLSIEEDWHACADKLNINIQYKWHSGVAKMNAQLKINCAKRREQLKNCFENSLGEFPGRVTRRNSVLVEK